MRQLQEKRKDLPARIGIAMLVMAGMTASGSLTASAVPVTYLLRFENFWDASHVAPGRYPASAHFTPLAGATHDATPLWMPGQSASLGIENVAELGVTTQLAQEITARILAGTASGYFQADGIFANQPLTEVSLTTDLAHRYLSAIAMIAPSPDWFVGVWGVDLAPEGQFLSEIVLDLRAWDAGSEEGNRFSLDNPDTVPRGVITRRFFPFVDDPVIGRITLTQIPEPGTGLFVALGLLGIGWRRGVRRSVDPAPLV